METEDDKLVEEKIEKSRTFFIAQNFFKFFAKMLFVMCEARMKHNLRSLV